jgi:hypothetical protein
VYWRWLPWQQLLLLLLLLTWRCCCTSPSLEHREQVATGRLLLLLLLLLCCSLLICRADHARFEICCRQHAARHCWCCPLLQGSNRDSCRGI